MKILHIEGKIVNHDEEFIGAIDIDPETGLIIGVTSIQDRSDLNTERCLIFPGFVDLHVHGREDSSGTESYKEDFLTISQAAIAGGVVAVADMPNNPIPPVDDMEYERKQNLTGTALIDIIPYAGIGPGTRPLSGQVPYKVFMGPSVGSLFFDSNHDLEKVIAGYTGQFVSFHCEDPEILRKNQSQMTHELKRPPEAEIQGIEFAIYLIEKYALQGKICHVSTRLGLEKIIAAKQKGISVTSEVTPHHLYFDGSLLQMNPPLRTREDRVALIENVREGQIDFLASDHAPHTKEEKMQGIAGVPELDTYGSFLTWLMVEQGFTPRNIVKVASYNPGLFLNQFISQTLGSGFGKIAEGYVGSLAIIDMSEPWTVSRKNLKTKCAWSPFEGITFPGRVKYTVVKGKVYEI